MKITKWYNSDVVYESTKETLGEAVIEAVASGADLRGTDLGGADLRGADLRGTNLGGANLGHTKFYGRGGETKIKTSQVAQFHKALGIVVEDDIKGEGEKE